MTQEPIPDALATDLMYDLSDGTQVEAEAALEAVLAADDRRFIAVLIEMLRFAQIGLVPPERAATEALQQLSQQSLGTDWPAWIEWYGGADLVPPPGFTGWKGHVLSRIDPRFGEFLQDDLPSVIRSEEIQWGGVLVDGIPALDQPAMLEAEEATYLMEDEPVFGIAISGEAHAYPLRILDWHEMANDTVGGVPISLAYCTLCGAAIAYDGRAADGATYDFGSSGFLFRSNKLMYDRQTRTLWNQLTGEPVLGPLVEQPVKLDLLPVVLTTWASWRHQHPDTLVLDIETGYQRPYELGSAYGDYFADPQTMFPVWQRSDLLDAKEQVYALQIDGVPVAYPIATLADEKVVNDVVGDTPLVVISQQGLVEVNGLSRRLGPVTYTAGSEVRAYERGDRVFAPGPSADTVEDGEGQVWQITEEALVAPNGETVPRINGHLAYWFGWYAFFPETLLYSPSTP